MRIISLWSGPRNVSTALMYSFAQRHDCEVVDEPLYAHYLSHVNVDHPGKKEIVATMDTDGSQVMKEQLVPGMRPLRFLKNMAHHWMGLDDSLLNHFTNIFLIRDPKEMLPSLINQITNPVLRDTGLKRQWELYQKLCEQGKPTAIIDSRELLIDPEEVLKKVCSQLNILFDPAMLSWKPGPIPEDGVWAKYWYYNVHNSCGFQSYKPKEDPFPKRLVPLLQQCEPYYNLLFDKSLKL